MNTFILTMLFVTLVPGQSTNCSGVGGSDVCESNQLRSGKVGVLSERRQRPEFRPHRLVLSVR